jgi:hypothetical protein
MLLNTPLAFASPKAKTVTKTTSSRTCWNTSVIPVIKRWKQEDCKFEDRLGYKVKSCLQKTKTNIKPDKSKSYEFSHLAVTPYMFYNHIDS